eukprot:CAMPEP_0119051570 /NCGR_PEP_ID=MMETSP1177-20130426/73144_1 /TAXON_ID=2985 /ORGANISM="Ochromonas sp, Strain CCMP1899" /LENGTH=255 /DNA_ID=CAMNT_0007030819 /DNA_START=186 /DNA_END=953 /DNA_ORIENTATION=+
MMEQASPIEGLPRWANFHTITGLLRALDYFGTFIFAISGSLTAATSGCDLLGCLMIGFITAVGGGTFRDVLLFSRQPFWFQEYEYVIFTIISSLAVFFYWGKLKPNEIIKTKEGGEGSFLQWADAVSLGAFSVAGAMNGIRAGDNLLLSLMCGLITCTGGGIMRDILLNRPIRIMNPHSEMYAPTAVGGVFLYLMLHKIAPAAQGLRIILTIAFVTSLRYNAWTYGLRLPFWNQVTQKVEYKRSNPLIQENKNRK